MAFRHSTPHTTTAPRRVVSIVLGTIVGSSSMIGAIVANQVHFNQTGSALIPFMATVSR
jgi:hypothetical protein